MKHMHAIQAFVLLNQGNEVYDVNVFSLAVDRLIFACTFKQAAC